MGTEMTFDEILKAKIAGASKTKARVSQPKVHSTESLFHKTRIHFTFKEKQKLYPVTRVSPQPKKTMEQKVEVVKKVEKWSFGTQHLLALEAINRLTPPETTKLDPKELSSASLKKAYHLLVRRFHPDTLVLGIPLEEAAENFQIVLQAYAIVKTAKLS